MDVLTWIAGIAILAAAIIAWRRWQKRERDYEGWIIGPIIRGKNHSHGMPLRPKATRQGWALDIKPGMEPHYVWRDCSGLSGAIRLRWRFAGAVEAVEGGPPTVSLVLQRKGDDWSAKGQFASYRWYLRHPIPLIEGETELTVTLDREHLKPVVRGGDGLEGALRHAHRVGLCFGSSGGQGHGIRGNARFELVAFEVIPD